MKGETLHRFDQQLTRYAIANLQARRDLAARGRLPSFRSLVVRELRGELASLILDPGRRRPEPLLLTLDDLDLLSEMAENAPFPLNRPWIPDLRVHSGHVHCAQEISVNLAPRYADLWAQRSAAFVAQLESERTNLDRGLRLVREWTDHCRTLLRAMGGVAYIPDAFSPVEVGMQHSKGAAKIERQTSLEEVAASLEEVLTILAKQRPSKAYYTTDEAAQALGMSTYTIGQWCRAGQCCAEKRKAYRGGKKQWMISHEELERLQTDGPASAGTFAT